MKRMIIGTLTVLSAVFSIQAMAADDLRLGNPVYGGTGCPRGTAHAALSPDQKTISILFDRYVAEAGRSTGSTIGRKSCDIAIPVHIPQGYSVSIFKTDYRGFNSLPKGSTSQFNVEYFFAGSQGPKVARSFKGPQDKNYIIPSTVVGTAAVWSACGANVNLRTNSNIFVKTPNLRQDAMMTVDSMDLKSGIIYHLQWKKCR